MLYYAQKFLQLTIYSPNENYNDGSGTCRCLSINQSISTKGEVDHQMHSTTRCGAGGLISLLITQPEDTLAVFGGDVQHQSGIKHTY